MKKEYEIKPIEEKPKQDLSDAQQQFAYRSWHLHYYMHGDLTGKQIDDRVKAGLLKPFTCINDLCKCEYEKLT